MSRVLGNILCDLERSRSNKVIWRVFMLSAHF